MIDVVINEFGGLTVAHDEKPLDGFDALDIAADGVSILSGPAGRREIGRLAPAMMAVVTHGMQGRMVRMSGFAIAKITPLTIRVQD